MATKSRVATEDAKAILNRVRMLVRGLRAFEKEAQRRFGLGAAQMFILHVLGHEDQLSLNELAERSATDQSSASLAAGRLVEDGYVRRTTSAEDRRQIQLSLTAKGRRVVRSAPPAAQERILAGVEAMSARERRQLMRLLDKLLVGIDNGSKSAPMLFQDAQEPRRGRARPRR